MVIFDDLHKLLLYQKLNLGFECSVCKRKFYNRLDHLQHTISCKRVSGNLKCQKCGKMFGHQRILQLHLQFHNVSESVTPHLLVTQTTHESVHIKETEVKVKETASNNNLGLETNLNTFQKVAKNLTECQEKPVDLTQAISDEIKNGLQTPIKIIETSKKQVSRVTKEKPKPAAKKTVGLTKIRMEDCLRCDACSCIYIDEKDYYKHMRNFHQLDVNNMPIPQQKSKRKCRSCCKQCRGVHSTPFKKPRATQRASNLIFKINMQDNIKNRWTQMVSQQLSDCSMTEFLPDTVLEADIKPDPDSVSIKPDPESSLDLSHLLCQVEVKIKTEPADDF